MARMASLLCGNLAAAILTEDGAAGVTRKHAGTILFDANGNRAIASKEVQVNVSAEGALSDEGKAVLIAIGIDNDGRVVDVYDSTKAVLGEQPKRGSNTASPRDPKGASQENIGRQFKKKIDRIAPEKGPNQRFSGN
jgi:hypothetical protein